MKSALIRRTIAGQTPECLKQQNEELQNLMDNYEEYTIPEEEENEATDQVDKTDLNFKFTQKKDEKLNV